MNLGFIKNEDYATSLFNAVATAGFDYVELPLSGISELTHEEFSRLEKALKTIPCRACNLFFPGTLKIVGEGMDVAGIKSYLAKMLPLAKNLGVETLVFGNGGARKVPEGAKHEDIWQNLRTVVEIMDEYAQNHNITIAVEPLNTMETNIINSYGEAAKLTTGLKNVATMVDSYHAAMEKQNFDDVFASPAQLKHLHTAYPTGRKVPSPKDDKTEYAEFVQMVKQLNFTDKISIEGGLHGEIPLEEEIAQSLTFLKGLFE